MPVEGQTVSLNDEKRDMFVDIGENQSVSLVEDEKEEMPVEDQTVFVVGAKKGIPVEDQGPSVEKTRIVSEIARDVDKELADDLSVDPVHVDSNTAVKAGHTEGRKRARSDHDMEASLVVKRTKH